MARRTRSRKPKQPDKAKSRTRNQRRETYNDGKHQATRGGPVAAQEATDVVKLGLRKLQALTLKAAGLTYRQIATQLGVSVRTAYMDVHEVLMDVDDMKLETVEKLRALENTRLDMGLNAIVPVLRGQIPTRYTSRVRGNKVVRVPQENDPVEVARLQMTAAERLTRNSARRAALNGLDMPTKVEHSTPDGQYAGMSVADLHALVLEKRQRLGLPVIDMPALPAAPPDASGNGARTS